MPKTKSITERTDKHHLQIKTASIFRSRKIFKRMR